MKKLNKGIAGLLIAVLVITLSYTPVNAITNDKAKVISLKTSFKSTASATMKKVEYFDVSIVKHKMTVTGKAMVKEGYEDYCISIDGKYGENGKLNGDSTFKHVVNFADYSKYPKGDHTLCVKFKRAEDASFPTNAQTIVIVVRNNSTGVFVKHYPNVEKEITNIRAKYKYPIIVYKDKAMSDMSIYDAFDGKKLTSTEVQYLTNLSNEIVGSEKNKYQQALLIHDYLAENLYYDEPYNAVKDVAKKKAMRKSGEAVLNPYKLAKSINDGYETKTVCNGFAAIFCALVRAQGISCRTITGRSITISSSVRGWEDLKYNINTPSHTWNEIYYDGRWISVDVTRDCPNKCKKTSSGQLVYSKEKYIKHQGFDPSLHSSSTAITYLNCSNVLPRPTISTITSKYLPVRLKWTQITGASGYKVYRASSLKGTYRLIKTVKGGSTLTYKDYKAVKGKGNYYKVRAYYSTGKYGSLSYIKSVWPKRK